jgi:hypothetical protein
MEYATQTKQSQPLYALAKEYLHCELQKLGISPDVVESYLCAPAPPSSLNAVYKQLLISAQNAHMRAGVVSGSLGGSIDRLGEVLFGFDASTVLSHFATPDLVLDAIEQKLKPNGKILRNPRSIWPQYCRTILSAAAFIAQFKSLKEFADWADLFCTNSKAYMAAPMMLAHEIHGLGFALACDFLKEIGYTKLGKPDVHIREILTAFDLCQIGDSDYELFKTLAQLAEDAGVTAYNADKLFWLIGSGKFYLHPQIGSIGNQKLSFIKFAKNRLA